MLVKRVASLSVDKVAGVIRQTKKSFILAYEAFSQLVRKSEELFQVNMKEIVVINFKIKGDIAVSSLRKDEDESVRRVINCSMI